MDTRNYDEPYNCGLENCDCSDDNNCGCSFPNNMSDFDCNCLNKETVHIDTPEVKVKKESVCFCSPEACSCTVERNETDNSSRN